MLHVYMIYIKYIVQLPSNTFGETCFHLILRNCNVNMKPVHSTHTHHTIGMERKCYSMVSLYIYFANMCTKYVVTSEHVDMQTLFVNALPTLIIFSICVRIYNMKLHAYYYRFVIYHQHFYQ